MEIRTNDNDDTVMGAWCFGVLGILGSDLMMRGQIRFDGENEKKIRNRHIMIQHVHVWCPSGSQQQFVRLLRVSRTLKHRERGKGLHEMDMKCISVQDLRPPPGIKGRWMRG